MYKLLQINKLTKNSWDALIGLSAVATWFQSYACYCFYKSYLFYHLLYMLLKIG
jgi:hypothetical protein